MTDPRFENGRWCCPVCWTRHGLWMPFLEACSGGCTCRCGYDYPSWVQTPQRAYERAQRLASEGAFDVVAGVDASTVDRTELVFDSLSSCFHYAGLKFTKL